MEPSNFSPLLLIGCFLLLGYIAHATGSRTHIPRVILLLLVGIAVGPIGFDLVPENASQWFPIASQAALSVIGFELGEKFLGSELRRIGKSLFIISISKVLGTALIVFLILVLFNVPIVIAIILAGIAPATAPAATADVIFEAKAKGEVSETTLRLVAIDDAWGVILFSLLLAVAASINGDSSSLQLAWGGVREIAGAIFLGVIIGFPMAWVTGRVNEGELTLIETLGFVFVCGGLAAALDLSYILACMSMGCVVSNFAHHHTRPFHAIQNVRQPFLVIFFLLAGYHADVASLSSLGLLSALYIVSRSVGVIVSAFVGAHFASVSNKIRNHVPLCMLPQAGVALGLALLAAERLPDLGTQILSTVVGTCIFFEIVGPLLTRAALKNAGEISD
jgi:Kef-type K+ transport system membrane component KefB